MSTEHFDQRFDAGDDIAAALDLERAERPGLVDRRVNVDGPAWMVEALDPEARRRDVTHRSVIKLGIADRLERRRSGAA